MIFNTFINFLLNTAKSLISFLLAPINLILERTLPNFVEMVEYFNNFIENSSIFDSLAYFGNILPPNTRGFVVLYINLVIAIYVANLSIHAFVKIFKIIQNIKFW